MKKIAVAVFTKINRNVTLCIEKAVHKAVFLHLSNYFEDAVYGTVIDLPGSPCYKSHGDREIIEAVSRCYGALPKKYKESFFVVVRARRYNVNRSKSEAFCCENGAYGALNDLIAGNMADYYTLGNVPDKYEYLFFSGSDKVIEAGGINALLKIAAATGKNVFPYIKNAPYSDYVANSLSDISDNSGKRGFNIKKRALNSGKREKTFSFLEGLYIREKARSIKLERIGVTEKSFTPKGDCILLKSVYVLNNPLNKVLAPNKEPFSTGAPFKRRKDFSRFSYRAALAASRVFNGKIEKNCISVADETEAAECLVALIAMRGFGFLGDAELIESSETLLDIIEEETLCEDKNTDKGKLLFLITAVTAVYSRIAFLNSLYWPIGLRVKELRLRLEKQITTRIVNNDNVYVAMCCNKAVLNINKNYALPKLMEMILSENEADISFGARGFEDVENALCVLAVASNVCFHGNIRDYLLCDPVFGARSSYLSRMTAEKTDFTTPKERKSEKKKRQALLLGKGLLPVKTRFSERGVDTQVIPFVAYFQRITRQIPINNNLTVVKICYIVDSDFSLLTALVKATSMATQISVCLIFSNFRAFAKAEKMFGEKVSLFLSDDKEKCEEVKRSSVLVRRLTSETTLSELMEEAKRYGRFKANVSSKPEMFSHCLCAGGGLKNGFCTFLQNGRNVSYGEFIKNPFTEVKSVVTTFVPRLRAKLIRVTLADAKYRSATQIFVLNEKGKALEVGDVTELSGLDCFSRTLGRDKLTVLKQSVDDGVIFAVQIFKNEREREYLQAKLKEESFFESCESAIKTELEVERRHAEILSGFIGAELSDTGDGSFISDLRAAMGRQVPRSFFSKMIFLAKVGELKGEKLPLAAKAYAEQFSDRKIFDVCLPAAYTKNGERSDEDGKETKNEYRYPFYIHCLDRMKEADRGFLEINGR